MNEIILTQTGSEVTADSRDVSIHFGKEHKNVIRDIGAILSRSSESPELEKMYIESSYLDSYGRSQKCYYMTRDGFSLLVMGFTGKEALSWKLKYIDAFNKMEKAITAQHGIPQTFAEALRLAAEQQEQIEQAKEALSKAQPAIIFARSVQTSDTSILIRDLAKLLKQNDIEIGEKRLFQWLRDHEYLTRANTPTQKAMELKLFEVKERTVGNPDGSVMITRTTMVTGKGQVYFINKFLEVKDASSKTV